MKPAWDQLADAWKDSTSVVVADVDCTAEEAKKVCSDQGISGYPSIMYYTTATGREGKSYEGGRDFDALNTFVEDELAEDCDTKTKAGCTEKEVAYIAKQSDKGEEKWNAEAKRLEGMMDQPMNEEKKQWLNQRINILEQMLGKKVAKKKGSSIFSWKSPFLWVFPVAVVLTLAVMWFCIGSSKAAKEEKKEEEKKEEEKKED